MAWRPVHAARIHRLFYPVVPVIVSAQAGGRVGAMPAISCIPVSFEPARVALALAPTHSTYAMVEKTKEFALNWLGFEHFAKIAYLGDTSGRLVDDKLAAAGFETTGARIVAAPVLTEAAAVAECRVLRWEPVGDHNLMVADVVAAYAIPDFEEYWMFEEYQPVFYAGSQNRFQRRYVTWEIK